MSTPASADRQDAVLRASLDELCVDTIRGLTIDAVEGAKCGHPGLPLGAAPMAHVLWTRHLRFNPRDPKWLNRDRFILSAGHGSMLLYALLHLTGYDLSLEEIKRFRQFESKTPGHPENFMTPGVEVATGPLGQGCGMSVGMAIAERFLAATFNRPGHEVIDHHTYVLCSDGDLMEGVSNEAASLAGHQKLGKLIWIYDDNGITIDGSTSLAFTEDVAGRFDALAWHVQRIDGMDMDAVDQALALAKAELERPSIIIARTTIGYGSPHKAGTSKSHGAALGPEEAKLTKENLGIPLDPLFYIPDEVLQEYRKAVPRGEEWQREWGDRLRAYGQAYPAEGISLLRATNGTPNSKWWQQLPSFGPDEKIATRVASGRVLNAIEGQFPTLMGGSADLAESNNTHIKSSPDMQAATPDGRNINFGVREHAMATACNGITLHGGCRGYAASFLIFTDYCRPALRLAALQRCPTIFVFTHDSIGLGEDGPTHQPIEHLMSLRAIPNFNLMRPCDGNETAACWKVALESGETPCLLALTRQAVPAISPLPMSEGDWFHPALSGAYVISEAPHPNPNRQPPSADCRPQVILIATGSEVHLALEAQVLLAEEGIAARVVSMPSWFLFEQQTESYRSEVLPPGVPAVSVEAGATLGWSKYAQAHVGLDHFGSSAPGNVLFEAFGFTPEAIAVAARSLKAEATP